VTASPAGPLFNDVLATHPDPRARRAFTLLEVLVAMVILAILASGLAIPLAAQVELRRQEATRRQLDEAKEALLGFAAAHGRLPCPASEASRGLESFAAGGDSANGLCSNFYDGYLPAAPWASRRSMARDSCGTRGARRAIACATRLAASR
jgi:prepilin-type N-terminal cleavage/methylation domain-containing protein